MTQLTTLTAIEVRAVLLGLAEHSSGTETDNHRMVAVATMAEALTCPRPVDPDLDRLRRHLARTLGADKTAPTPNDEDLLHGVAGLGAERAEQAALWRDQLSALLDLDPWATDEDITETATARAAQRAQQRAAAKTAALVTPTSAQPPNIAVRLLNALAWTHDGHPAPVVVDRALDEVTDQGRAKARLQRRYDELAAAARTLVDTPAKDTAGLGEAGLRLARVLGAHGLGDAGRRFAGVVDDHAQAAEADPR